jgi:Fe-S-cluster-containing hydrogenase component 2
MAREAGLLTWLKPPEDVIERFKAFADLVRADEREACAKVCDEQAFELYESRAHHKCAEYLAEQIRARGNI